MLGGVLRLRKSPRKGFCGGWAGTPFLFFFSGPRRPLTFGWQYVFAFQFGPIILASRILVGFMPAPYTFREKVI